MDVDPSPSFGAPGDPPSGTNLNLQQLLDLVHYFPHYYLNRVIRTYLWYGSTHYVGQW